MREQLQSKIIIIDKKTQFLFDSKLGYRLRLVKAVLPTLAGTNEDTCFRIELANDGYAAPINPRQVKLVLRGK